MITLIHAPQSIYKRYRHRLFFIIIVLLMEINDNSTKRFAYFRFYDNLLQRFELREARKSSLLSDALRL